jgi:hypothetical protein
MDNISETDFEKHWVAKFSDCLDRIGGEEIRKKVLQGTERITSRSSRKEVIDWTKEAMDRLDALVDEEKRMEIMTGCACEYPESDLQEIRKAYQQTKDIDLVHTMLQEKFLSFLRDSLKLSDELIEDIVNRGWGLAGVKKGNTIIATKIPKSGSLVEYMKEADPEKKRALCCHCPRIREAIGSNTKISSTYCYCGAGFYEGIWEYILQRPVKVELLAARWRYICR